MREKADQRDQILSQFTRQAESYTKLTAGLGARSGRDDLAAIGARADDLALDVACGSGSLALPLAARVEHVTAIDLTPAMIEQGKARQRQMGTTNIEWRIGDVDPLPFPDQSFTLVTCSAAFHHFERPERVLREMVRVCRAGGRIVVRDMAFRATKAAAFDAMERRRDPSHVAAHTLDGLRAFGAGLPIEEVLVEPYSTPPLPLEAILGTSFPTDCSLDDIRATFRDDLESGEDRLGLQAHVQDGSVMISYPMATIVWQKSA